MNTPLLQSVLRNGSTALILALTFAPLGCAKEEPPRRTHGKDSGATFVPPRCSAAWNQMVDRRLHISDDGHGPDIGSAEWMGAVGRKSGVDDGSGHGPDLGSDEWCRAVDYKVFGRR